MTLGDALSRPPDEQELIDEIETALQSYRAKKLGQNAAPAQRSAVKGRQKALLEEVIRRLMSVD